MAYLTTWHESVKKPDESDDSSSSKLALLDTDDGKANVTDQAKLQSSIAAEPYIDPASLAKLLDAHGAVDQFGKSEILLEVAGVLGAQMNDFFAEFGMGNESFGSQALSGLKQDLSATLEEYGISMSDAGPEAPLGSRLGMYMDGYGSTDGFDTGDFLWGAAKAVVGGHVAAGTVGIGVFGEVGTLGATEGGISGPMFVVGLLAGGVAYDGFKEAAGEVLDGAGQVVNALSGEEEDEPADTQDSSDMGGLPMGREDESSADEEGSEDSEDSMTFTEEEVYGESDTDDEEEAGEDSSNNTDEEEEDSMTFTEDEVYGESEDQDPDAEESADEDQTPVDPNVDDGGGLSREQFEEVISGPDYGSSTGAGTMMPAEDAVGTDGFIFAKVNHNDSTGAGVMMPEQDDEGLSPEELAIILSQPDYGSSTGAGVMMPKIDDGSRAGHATGELPENPGGDGTMFDAMVNASLL